ncbi:sensor histidine kinase [Dawidia soli]|uniref:histidine kinase n=1 Tax=Dawidia soli TaxID=2782352 RepID=A0AAP2DEV1_9BACT|nr:sensor histidine kinase [Dawidia soli]MBT1690723.1 sensor histidine kinase [Dawidia soli]
MHRKIPLLVLLLLLFSVTAQPQGLRLSDSGWLTAKGHMRHWRDATGQLTIDQIREMKLDSLPPADAPNFGFDRAVHWFRFDVTNDSHEEDWMMEVSYAPLDHIDFYIASDSSLTWVHKVAGDTLPISARTLRHRHPVFSFSLQPGESQSIYLRVQTVSSVQMPVTFWHRRAFLNGIYNIQLVNGLFYGGMILMMLYQLFLFFSVRDKITFYYVCTLLTMVNIVGYFQGYTFLYLFPQTPVLNDVFAMFSGPAFVMASTMLTRSFLNLPKFSRLLDRLMLLNMSLNLVAGILMFIFFRKISYQYHHYFILVHCVLALVSAGYCFYKKYRSARYYLMAWITILLATSVFTMSNLGFVPGYMSTNYSGLMIGCILQMLFISFALGDRWNILEKENRRAKELELKRNQEENERLEREVLLRTEEIQNKSERLEEVNRVKDKLFSVVSHDIKGPLSSLQLALSLLRAGDVSREEFQQLSNSLEERFSHTTEFIENLLQWATLQLKGESYEPAQINLSDIADETVSLLSTEIKRKNITVRNNLHNYKLQAYADLNMIRSVLRNLFTNAIKFTGENGMITLSFLRTDRQVIVSVADTGVGIPASHRKRLFTLNSITTPGTSKEKGTGLGLLLCREFIEKNGGRIWFETTEGKGTTFFFSLPESGQATRQSMANG